MKLWKKTFLGVLGVTTLILVSMAGVVAVALYNSCANEIWSENVSPDGSIRAVVFERNCGATTGFSTHVSLIEGNSSLPNQGGNVLTLKGRPENVGPEVSWDGDLDLHIHRTLNGEEFDPQAAWSASSLFRSRDIRIRYDF